MDDVLDILVFNIHDVLDILFNIHDVLDILVFNIHDVLDILVYYLSDVLDFLVHDVLKIMWYDGMPCKAKKMHAHTR